MANTLDFFMAMPKLCGAKNADRWAWIIEEVYLAELAGNTPFDKNEEDEKDFANRLEVAFAFKASDEGAKEQCKRLAKIILLSHYIADHGKHEYQTTLDNLVMEASAASASYPEINSVMTVDQAAISIWEP